MAKKSPLAVTSMTVQGTMVNSTIIAAYSRRVGSLDDVLSVWANAATLQVAVHGNRNWIDSLFALPVMRLTSGALSKTGKEVFAYIAAHCPRVVWDKEHNKVALTKLQKESALATHFVAVGVKHESELPNGLGFQFRDKFYTPHGDFALTFSAFKNLEKPEVEKEEKEESMTAKAFVKQAEKALSCFKAERFVGTSDELLSAMLKAKELFLALDAQILAQEKAAQSKLAESGIAATADDKIDTAKAAQSAGVGTNRNGKTTGKDTRAGGKVAPTAAQAA